MANNQYTRFGFERVKHNVSKNDAVAYHGTITFTTTRPVDDEIEAARDMEALIRGGQIPLFGHTHSLAHLSFTWATETDKSEYGEKITCVLVVGYKSYIDRMSREALDERLVALLEATPSGEGF